MNFSYLFFKFLNKLVLTRREFSTFEFWSSQFLLSKFFIRWHDARRGFNSTQLKNEEVMSGDYQASGRQDSATSDSSNSFFIDTNRAQLPRGIRQVRTIHYLLHRLFYFKTLNRVFVKRNCNRLIGLFPDTSTFREYG